MNIYDAARPFRDAFNYDPGHSDLDDEQPISINVTLGNWRKLEIAMADEAAPAELPSLMLEALDITREAVAAQVESEALALLRELNDALLPIPDALQARLDAILDVSDAAGVSVSKEK